VLNHPKFLQKDLSKQPQPYAAISLIAKEPVRFIDERIATCQGNKRIGQGHPRVFINLDAKKVGTCGYCGLRYAQEAYKDDIKV
jgi:NADH dehydrogenase (ubiquinone) Fe-S protein 6